MSSKSPITQAVMKQIAAGNVRMKPRWYFTLLTTLSAGAIILTSLAIAYAWSLLLFWIRIETASTMAWGARANAAEALASFPWWALGTAIVLGSIAVWLVRHHGQLYRHSARYVVLVLLAASFILGLFFTYVDLPGLGRSHTPQSMNGRGPGWQR